MVVNGIVGLLNDDRSSTTRLLVDLARTSAGCNCIVRSPLLHTVCSLNAFITEGIGKRKRSPFVFILYALIIRCKNYFVFFIFVVKAAHENILTTKISRSTVCGNIGVSCSQENTKLQLMSQINAFKTTNHAVIFYIGDDAMSKH